MKKTFCVAVDITMAKNFYIEAENEEQAIASIRQNFKDNPYDIAQKFDAYVGYEIIDAVEED